MYLEGSEYVEYTPVEAYAVMPMAEGIISGGTGDETIVVQSTRFFWVFDPDNIGGTGNGFTGHGWFTSSENMPLYGVDENKLEEDLRSGALTNLNDYFRTWQQVVNNQPDGSDYVTDFMQLLGWDRACFSNNA